MKIQKTLLIGLILLSNALNAGGTTGLVARTPALIRSSMIPLRSSVKPTQPTQFCRTFLTNKPTNTTLSGKTFSRPTNINLGTKNVGGFLPKRGMSTQYLQQPNGASWQGGNRSFNSRFWIPLAATLGYSLAKPDKVSAEEYTPEDAARLIGFKSLNDLNSVNSILNFLNSGDYKSNGPLFSLVVANRINDFLPALKGALEILQEDKGEKSLEKIRFLNQVILDVNDLNKISYAKTKIEPFKKALESLLTIEFERPAGTKYVAKVGNISQIKDDSMLSRMIDALNKDPQFKAYFLDQLSANTAAVWGYAGGLIDIEARFKEAQDSLHALPKAYQELAEMIAQNPSAYSNVKAYAADLPTLFNAVQEIEKRYSVPVLRKKVEKQEVISQLLDAKLPLTEPSYEEQPNVIKKELIEGEQSEQKSSIGSSSNGWIGEKIKNLKEFFRKPNDS